MVTAPMTFLRHVFMLIDSVLAWFVGETYQLLLEVSQIDLFKSTVGDFKDRLFVLIAVFMIFKLSLSIIKYILDPEQMTASSKGGAELVKRVIIVLALLVSVTWIFNKAMELQELVLESDVISDIFLGDEHTGGDDGGDSELTTDQVGNFISYQLLASFLDFNRNSEAIREAIGDKDCNNIFITGENACEVDELKNWTTISTKIEDARTNFQTSKIADIMSYEILGATYKNEYVFKYNLGISTICLLAAGIILAIFTIDVAVRSIKLGFLHLIAPLPIISYIDPNQKNDMFGKWVKTCISTYVELFIKLAALYFVIGIIKGFHIIFVNPAAKIAMLAVQHPLLYPTVLLGLLVFLVRVPKLIQDITGFKIEGGTLKDLKTGAMKVTNAVTSVTSVPLAMVGGFTANSVARGINMGNRADADAAAGNRWSVGRWAKETGMVLGSGLAGGFMAMGRTGFANYKSGGKGAFGNMRTAITRGSAERNLRMEQGYGYMDRVKDAFSDMAQIKNQTGTTGALSQEVKRAKMALDDARQQLGLLSNNDAFRNRASSAVAEALEHSVDSSTGMLEKKYKDYKSYLLSQFGSMKDILKSRYGMDDSHIDDYMNKARSSDSIESTKAIDDIKHLFERDEKLSRQLLDESQFMEATRSLERYIEKDSQAKTAEKNYNKLSEDQNKIKNANSKK